MDKYLQLKNALRKAIEAAEQFRGTEDGGTCNFDSPTLKYAGMQKKKVIEVLESLGLSCFEWNPYRTGNRLVICGFQAGMGNCRSRMSEAFDKSMRESGYDSGMYYQMD